MAKCKICNDYGFIIGEDHVTREICPSRLCVAPPKKMPYDSKEEQKIALKMYNAKIAEIKDLT